MYKEKRPSRSEFVPIRGYRYHVRIWDGPTRASPALPPMVLAHGWMDVAASYQFMVDAFSDGFALGRTILAPDWRGFGLSRTDNSAGVTDTFWFPDYLADLDFLLDHFAQKQPVDLVGHSMGGNVAMTYAGIRPERIRRLVNLEGFGLPASLPAQAPARYAKWIGELKSLHRSEVVLKTYADAADVARRLMKTNPRLSADKAHWLACHWAQPDAAGTWHILGEAGHKITSANLYRADETLALYQRISAPVLAVQASGDSLSTWHQGRFSLADYHARLQLIPQATVVVIEAAGHMLHHDQPEQLAALIEGFLAP